MIHALDKKKTSLHNNYGEDTKVSSTLGVLKNLPAELFWQILRKSCKSNINLPKHSGEILNIEFWPGGWKCVNRVEPDVYIEFEDFDLIIEAKVNDQHGQISEQEQWRKEIIAYLLNRDLKDLERPLYLLALGGNQQMHSELITITSKDIIFSEQDIEENFIFRVEVFKANWFTLLNVISDIHKQFTRQEYYQSDIKSNLRIIEDAVIGFNLHQIYAIDWFDSFQNDTTINQEAIDNLLKWNYEKY